MTVEAMKQALEALNTGNNEVLPEDYGQMVSEAITALRAAIEEAEKPWVKTYSGGKPNLTTPEESRTSIGALLSD